MSVTLSGMFSGLDTEGIIAQLTALNRRPITELQQRQALIDRQDGAYASIRSSFTNLRSRLNALNDTELFARKSASVADSSIGTATASTSAASGAIKLEITQLATASTLAGGKASSIRAGSATLESVFGSSVAGTLSVNGTTVTLTAAMTLSDAASALNSALSGSGGSASYNATTGRFTLNAGSGSLLLGTGTSDFFQKAQLFNNGTGTVTSQNAVGTLDASGALSSTVSGLGSSGSIRINSVDVAWSSSDSLSTVLERINNSEAGVVATYDSYQDRIQLTSKSRGANAITVSDVTGNLAQRLAMRSGQSGEGVLALGSETRFKVNDGTERTSVDATLDASELGVSGVTFNASKTGTTTVQIAADVTAIKGVIDEFVSQYNSLQNIIASYRRVDPNNPSANGDLANDSALAYLPNEMRSIVGSALNSGGAVRMLEDLGITGSGDSSTLGLTDSTLLREALESNPDDVVALFTDATNGLATRLGTLISAYAEDGTNVIATRRENLASEKSRMDREIELIEARVAAETSFLRASFAALESASSQSSQFSSFFRTNNSSG